ncbi:MAG TPA: formylglycine-generating enzyme family protein [Bacteroidales bacterium]|nr:formylglycine-generating enzyme family protein [Bacteroidales bacterium]
MEIVMKIKNKIFVPSVLILFFYLLNSSLLAESAIFTNKLGMRFVLIPAGNFIMGSPESEEGRQWNETQHKVVISKSFYMGDTEVTQGQWEKLVGFNPSSFSDLGKNYPVDSISWNQCVEFIRVLNDWEKTDKYRLPTEAEWEYACRAGSDGPYFFPGDPNKFQKTGLKAKLSKNDTAVINTYVVYKANSLSKTQPPDRAKPNPFGLRNMPGNVAEFCSDWYQPDAYSLYPDGVVKDPKGPDSGDEHVVRGGSFQSTADVLRSAARDYTRTEAWLKTDPQMPKSIWWYSDCFNVGFRVVCEFDEKTGNVSP